MHRTSTWQLLLRRTVALPGVVVLLAALSVSAQPAQAAGGTLFGTCLRNGMPFASALKLADTRFGPMETVRIFYNGNPASWSGDLGKVGRPVAVSFKYNVQDVLAGKEDAYMTQWFRAAPTDRKTFWSLNHEPEDQVEHGAFTALQYRQAWNRLAGLAAKAGNPKLVPTLTLMYWTFNPDSGRHWRDYLAAGVIKVVAIDGYNWAANRSPQSYAPPERIFGNSFAAIKAAGYQVAAAEVGSVLIKGDDGTQRATFITATGNWLQQQGALYGDWYDYNQGTDYRLDDGPSIRAWRAFSKK